MQLRGGALAWLAGSAGLSPAWGGCGGEQPCPGFWEPSSGLNSWFFQEGLLGSF